MLHRRDDVQLSSIEIAQGKAKTALMFKRPSKVLDDAISSGGAGLRFLALKDIVPLEGGLPIVAGRQDRRRHRRLRRAVVAGCAGRARRRRRIEIARRNFGIMNR